MLTGRPSDASAAGVGLSVRDCLVAVRLLAEQVQSLHQGGRVHRRIAFEDMYTSGVFQPELPAPPAGCRFGVGSSRPDLCPPELADAEPLELPESREAAAKLLGEQGHSLAPERIDLYQLGTLLCRLLTGRPIQAYMYDPRVKAQIPPIAEPILRRSLGYRAEDRYVDCGKMLDELDAALEHLPREEKAAPETGAAGETPAASRPDAPLPVERLGPFRVIRRIGRGGMADVYEGYDERHDRNVAVKVLPPELARDEDLVRRFRAEAEAVQRISHPNVVRVHFAGEEGGRHFFAMELIDGESLAARIRRQGQLPLDETLPIVRQCLEGLAEAHSHGLVHRDVKPSNVLLERATGRAVLVDFGLVRVLGEASRITAPGQVMGTVDYIAPEQARGEPVDARADLYAVGVLMYHALAGRLPFSADSPAAVMLQHAYKEAPPLDELVPGLPANVTTVVAKLMSKAPADRYQTAREALDDVRALVEGRPVKASVPLPAKPEAADMPTAVSTAAEGTGTVRDGTAGASKRRAVRRWGPGIAAAVFLLAVGGLLLSGLLWPDKSPQAPSVSGTTLKAGERLPESKWVDMLPTIDPEWHAISGNWQRDDEDLITGPEWYSRIMLPVEIDGGYDLVAEVTRVDGDGSINVILPVAERSCVLYLGAWDQAAHGLGTINGRLPRDGDSPASRRPGTLINGRRYQVEVSVRIEGEEAKIEVSLDNEPLVAWNGKQRSLDAQPALGLPELGRLALGAVGATVRYHKVWLRVASGRAAMLPLPEPPELDPSGEGWVDLLAGVEPDRDAVAGSWRRVEDGIGVAGESAEQPFARLMLSKPVAASYDLVAEFTRTSGSDSVVLVLPTANQQVGLHFSACAGNQGGLETIDGMNIVDSRNPALRRPSPLVNAKRHRVLAQVRTGREQVSINVWLDGKPFLRWSGRQSQLALDTSWSLPQRNRVGVGANVSAVTFHTVRVRPARPYATRKP